jgi:hypothetical protein
VDVHARATCLREIGLRLDGRAAATYAYVRVRYCIAMEAGGTVPTLALLEWIAQALQAQLIVKFEPKHSVG